VATDLRDHAVDVLDAESEMLAVRCAMIGHLEEMDLLRTGAEPHSGKPEGGSRDLLETEHVAIEPPRLLGVAYVQRHVMNACDLHGRQDSPASGRLQTPSQNCESPHIGPALDDSKAVPGYDREVARVRDSKRLKRALERVEHAALVGSVAGISRMSPAAAIRVGAALGAIYGRVVAAVGGRDDRIARANLALAFPGMSEDGREELLARMWRNTGRLVAEIALLDRWSRETPGRIRELVTLDTREALAEVFARAKEAGSLVLTAHFGSFELLHAGCAAHGFPISLVHRNLPNPLVDRWLTDLRERCGARVLRRGAAARQILEELRAKRVVAIAFDQRAQEQGRILVPFFSVPAPTPSGLARVAMSARAPVFPVVLLREGESHRHRALILPEIPISRTGDRATDVFENSIRFNGALEELIRAHPDHWIWMYRRWPGPTSPLLRAA
jgi:Kdo2-lipid IVA lauroyltransferase/acyltransferase